MSIPFLIGQAIIVGMDRILFFVPDVEELPFGMESYISTFMGNARAMVDIFPFFDIILKLFILGLFIEFSFFLVHWARIAFKLITGRG